MRFSILEEIMKDAKVLSILAITGFAVGLGIARLTTTEEVLPTKEEVGFEEASDFVPGETLNLNTPNSYREEKK